LHGFDGRHFLGAIVITIIKFELKKKSASSQNNLDSSNNQMSEAPPQKKGLKFRLGLAFKPKAGVSNKLTKAPPPAYGSNSEASSSLRKLSQTVSRPSTIQTRDDIPETPEIPKGPINFYNKAKIAASSDAAQTGETWDNAEMLHSLLRRDSHDSLASIKARSKARNLIPDLKREPGEESIKSLPPALWDQIASYLNPVEAANLCFASKALCSLLGSGPWDRLKGEEMRRWRAEFLLPMERLMPDHLFCFPCGRFHIRRRKGEEIFKHSSTLNHSPLFICPFPKSQSRARITPGWTLPFSFVQLAFRCRNFGPEFGIPLENLNRRYKDRTSTWTHQIRFFFHKSHLLMRCISQTYAEGSLPLSLQRHLLYSREDYTPYFSVCAHWRDGELMKICKCALSHIPPPKATIGRQLAKGPKLDLSLRNPKAFVSLCEVCRPMRRCPECATEYLVELKLVEDRAEEDRMNKFKQALVVTRWSDLGDGMDPEIGWNDVRQREVGEKGGRKEGQGGGEWKAMVTEESREYDSFKALGRRGLSGTFESQSGVTLPGQRLLSLNPRNERLGEEGHGWY
jgi:hypothetical protein